jgi:dihydropteroate synthase
MHRPLFIWQLRTRSLQLGRRTLIMGVVNVTPDSFFDGGQFFDTDKAIAHALELLRSGADILDIGGEYTRPGKKDAVSADEEKRRVLPVVEGVLREAPDAVISVDTYKSETAIAALTSGAEIINDVSGFTWDTAMLDLLVGERCGCVLMHTRGRPEEWRTLPALKPAEVLPLVKSDLHRLSARAVNAGISKERIVVDPGFGFGKRLEENYPLLANFSELHDLGFPLLSGTSRKSFIAKTALGEANAPSSDRIAGTVATVTASILQGAHIVRVHDAKPAAEAVRIADAILKASEWSV